MDWVKDFYSKTGRWWGPAEAKVSDRDYSRVEMIKTICGPPPQLVLELGCGYGTTAAATAQVGYDVVACEISERIDFAKQFESSPPQNSLRFVQGDFYTNDLGSNYDVITYWNGFGIGSDSDQRRLLTRISKEWLSAGGKALIDIGNPFVRSSWDGGREHKTANPEKGYAFTLDEITTYDPVHNRFIDTWWESDNVATAMTQSLRNYTPADLILLLEGTGLKLENIYVAGSPLDLDSEHPSNPQLLKEEQEYLAVLVADDHK